ncbi:MAG: hypothetical protein G5701_00465 [Serratia symbiotica]|nr:hypothetical protein [Serratia symbiotica]
MASMMQERLSPDFLIAPSQSYGRLPNGLAVAAATHANAVAQARRLGVMLRAYRLATGLGLALFAGPVAPGKLLRHRRYHRQVDGVFYASYSC